MLSKAFCKYMMDKPDPYLRVWLYIYANSDDSGVFSDNYTFLLSRFKISRTTLMRIVDYGCEWAESGQKVGRKWANNQLIINIDMQFSGQKVGRKWAESGQEKTEDSSLKATVFKPKKVTKAKSDNIYPSMVDAYNEFCIQRTGLGAKMNAAQGKSMKNIIEYLGLQVRNKNTGLSDDLHKEETVKAFKYILDNWGKITGYYSEQIKLSQIDSNLPNILLQLRKTSKNNRDEKFASTINQVGQIDFGQPNN